MSYVRYGPLIYGVYDHLHVYFKHLSWFPFVFGLPSRVPLLASFSQLATSNDDNDSNDDESPYLEKQARKKRRNCGKTGGKVEAAGNVNK